MCDLRYESLSWHRNYLRHNPDRESVVSVPSAAIRNSVSRIGDSVNHSSQLKFFKRKCGGCINGEKTIKTFKTELLFKEEIDDR